MGSKDSVEVKELPTFSQTAPGVPGQTWSFTVTRSVWRIDWKKILPVFQLTPIDGSLEEGLPMPAACCASVGVKIWKRGGTPVASFAGPTVTMALPLYWPTAVALVLAEMALVATTWMVKSPAPRGGGGGVTEPLAKVPGGEATGGPP